MIRDALYLVVAVVVLILVADYISRRALKDTTDALKDSLPSVPSLDEVVQAPAVIAGGFWDFIKAKASDTPNDASYITTDEQKRRAETALAARRSRLSRFGAGLQ